MVDKTVRDLGVSDVAVNNAGTRRARPDHGADCAKLCRDVDTNVLRRRSEHEARSARHAGPGERQHHQISPPPTGHEGAAGSLNLRFGAKHAVEGITKSVALRNSPSRNFRVNAVAPGPIETGHADPGFTGHSGKTGGPRDQVPLGRLRLSEEVADGIGVHRVGPSPVHHGTSSMSTAVTARMTLFGRP